MKKIIIVDDDPDILTVVKDFMEEHDIKVITLQRSNKALDLAIKEEPDLIILDISMPDKNGIEILKELKNNPLTDFIPVIMLTGKKSTMTQINGLASGADDYVTKPFDLNVLYARILSVSRRSLQKTRQKYDQFNLLHHLIKTYSHRNYEIYTKLLDEYPDHPQDWHGPVPDLIIDKANKRRFFCFENTQSIMEESFLERLKAFSEIILNKPLQTEGNIVVRTKKNAGLVKNIIAENNYNVNVKLIKHRH